MVGVSPCRRKGVNPRGLVQFSARENFAKVGCGSLPQPGAFRKKERATLFAEFPSTLVARYDGTVETLAAIRTAAKSGRARPLISGAVGQFEQS
jgi:hypothetical protein